MRDIIICIIGIIGLIACKIIENSMWEHDREKAFGYELKHCAKMEETDERQT